MLDIASTRMLGQFGFLAKVKQQRLLAVISLMDILFSVGQICLLVITSWMHILLSNENR